MISSRLFCSTLPSALGLATVVDPLDPSSCLVLLEVRRSCLRCRCSSAPTPSLLMDPWLVSICCVLPVASAQQAHQVKSGNVVSIVLWPPCADDDDTCLNRNVGRWPQDALASRALESPRKPRRIQESSRGRPRRAQKEPYSVSFFMFFIFSFFVFFFSKKSYKCLENKARYGSRPTQLLKRNFWSIRSSRSKPLRPLCTSQARTRNVISILKSLKNFKAFSSIEQ